MKKYSQTVPNQVFEKIHNAINNLTNTNALPSNDSIETLAELIVDCPLNLVDEFIVKLKAKVGESAFSLIQTASHYKKFEITLNCLPKGKKLDFDDNGNEFALRDDKNAYLPGMSQHSADTLEQALLKIDKGLSDDQDPLYLMTIMNKLVASTFGKNVLSNHSKLINKYHEIRNKIVQAVADALHAYSANIFNKIEKEELKNSGGYSDIKQCPNLLAMDSFIAGLAFLIEDIILGNNHDLDVRTLQLHDIIAVAEKLAQSGSFNAFMGIFVALTTTPIHRLKNTWEGLTTQDKKLFKSFEILMDPSDDKKNARAKENSLREKKINIQPQIAIVKSDIIYAKDWKRNKDGTLNIEAYQERLESIINPFLEAPCTSVDKYDKYTRKEFQFTMQECNEISKPLLGISISLEPHKRGDTPVGSGIISSLASSGLFNTVATSIYKKLDSGRGRSSSVTETPKTLEKLKQSKLDFYNKLLFILSPEIKDKKITELAKKRQSECPVKKVESWPRFHRRTKSVQPTPDNWLPPRLV